VEKLEQESVRSATMRATETAQIKKLQTYVQDCVSVSLAHENTKIDISQQLEQSKGQVCVCV